MVMFSTNCISAMILLNFKIKERMEIFPSIILHFLKNTYKLAIHFNETALISFQENGNKNINYSWNITISYFRMKFRVSIILFSSIWKNWILSGKISIWLAFKNIQNRSKTTALSMGALWARPTTCGFVDYNNIFQNNTFPRMKKFKNRELKIQKGYINLVFFSPGWQCWQTQLLPLCTIYFLLNYF